MSHLILPAIFLVAAGIAKALMDHSSEAKFKKTWFNKSSWINKWKLDNAGQLIPYQGKPKAKYLWAFTPHYVERYYLSSSLFAFATDGWHFFQLFFLLFISAAIAGVAQFAGYSFVIFLIGARLCLGIAFTITRRFVLKNPN